jgi:hypothetical protein
VVRGQISSLVDPDRADLAQARREAIRYLISKQDPRGFWHDFETLAGSSDEWVTGYIGSVLAEAPDPPARQAAHKSWLALCRRRRWSGAWGFNRITPADADSTVWGLQLAVRLGVDTSRRAQRAFRFVDRHQLADGALATYRRSGPIRHFTRLHRNVSFDGWCSGHVCVTAAGSSLEGLPGRDRMLAYLRKTQLDDGSWPAYWWADREYSTGLAAQALVASPDSEDIAHLFRAGAWAANRILTRGRGFQRDPLKSPFATSCCLITLTHANGADAGGDAARQAVDSLFNSQRDDGSWAPSAALRIPPPHMRDPDLQRQWLSGGRGGGSIQVDRKALYTTASVLKALNGIQHG